MTALLRVWTRVWALLLWRRRLSPPPVAPDQDIPVPSDVVAPTGAMREPRQPRPKSSREQPQHPTWHFRDTILERLEEYFVCIRRLRRHDADAYELFARVGFAIAADWFYAPVPALPASWRQLAFGGILFPQQEEDGVLPSFIYFHKLHRLAGQVQSFAGAIYKLTLLYDDRDRARHWASTCAVPLSCHIGVLPDGSLRLLKEAIITRRTVMPQRRHGQQKPSPFALTHREWNYPVWIRDAALHDPKGRDPQHWLPGLLIMALKTYSEAVSRIVIRAQRDGCTAAFGIDLPRAKYFFRDRDKETALARDGHRKRIFHSVRAHQRLTTRGDVSVREHFRGLRIFDWQSFRIRIVYPGREALLQFDMPGRSTRHPLREHAGMAELGERFAGALDA